MAKPTVADIELESKFQSEMAKSGMVVKPPVAFRPPAVGPGQIVLWRFGPNSNERPAPAVVLNVTPTTLNVALVVEGMRDLRHHSGVRHRDDPFLDAMPEHAAGVWELTPRDRRIDALLAQYEFGDDPE
jgi:hypothetical protein